jgi:cytidylate kinase
VAIDGPAGAGKSTVARRVADELGFVLVDTGALYRAVALAAKRANVPFDDARAVGALAHDLVRVHAITFERDPLRGVRVMLGGDDVSEAIRTPDIGMGASTVSAHPEVRAALLDLQRQAGLEGGVVLEGRDIGTVVFPDAELKFFLTALAEVRGQRRYDELRGRGEVVTYEATLADVKRRDEQDTSRAAAPLRCADDAIEIDSSSLTIDEAVKIVVDRARAYRP